MKNVLVISYYFPPNTGAPAWRPFSWANNFYKKEINTTVITRHWTGHENTWEEFIRPNNSPITEKINDHYRVYFLPSKRNKWSEYFSGNGILAKVFGKFYFLLLAIYGKLNTEIDGTLAFKDFIIEHLKQNKYDVAIITVPPFNMLQMVDMFHEHKIKVIVDVRDLWNNIMLTNNYQPGIQQQLWDKIYSFHFKRWMKNASRVIVITPSFVDVIAKSFNGSIDVIYNGYEGYLFDQVVKLKTNKFTFSVIGSIYPEQDMSVMIDGLKLFLENKSSNKVQLRFIGLNVIPAISQHVKKELPSDFLHVSDRVLKEEAIEETKMATVLSYPGWLGIKGIISTKIFDYIASGNPILIAPGDNDIIDDLLVKTKTGESVFSAQTFADVLNKWYNLWEENQDILTNSNSEVVQFYSRENQAMALADIINNL
jgi:glycosyltransferase involved in cell wall biosynthesis